MAEEFDPDKFSPATKPIFMDPERVKTATYVGHLDTSPTFDNEITPLPALDGELEPRGKGPSRGYEERWRMIAKLHARGYTNNQIARHLGYSAPGLSLALNHPWTQNEVALERERLISPEAITIMKQTSLDAALNLQRIVRDQGHDNNYAASVFVTEKNTGKARQEIQVESGTLMNFTELLKEMMSRGETLDVTPQPTGGGATQVGPGVSDAAPQLDEVDAWMAAHPRR